MNKDYYRQKIREYLFSRDVKKPGIRMNALERVFNYMKSDKRFILVVSALSQKRKIETEY